MNLKKQYYIDIFILFSIFVIDRVSKIYVIYLDNKNLQSEIFLSKFLNIQLVWNEGIAFGLLSFNEKSLYDILTIIIFLVIIFILFLIFKSSGFKKFSLLTIAGGAFGNFYDRIAHRAVPDFIDFHVGNFHWFIFNIADIFITIGVVFMISIELTSNNKNI
tara:strand:- start:387 stop:869 length:483 start_codon:yes stop_codon:yes gene_type:complete